jgi:hypothetical protein
MASFGQWTYSVDRDATALAYSQAEKGGVDTCDCVYSARVMAAHVIRAPQPAAATSGRCATAPGRCGGTPRGTALTAALGGVPRAALPSLPSLIPSPQRYIGGLIPCVPTVTRPVDNCPSASLRATTKTLLPGLRSAADAGAKVTTGAFHGTWMVTLPLL